MSELPQLGQNLEFTGFLAPQLVQKISVFVGFWRNR